MSLDSFSTDGDWMRIRVKFPGKCMKCIKKLEPGDFCYWSRSAKSILHEDCYQVANHNEVKVTYLDKVSSPYRDKKTTFKSNYDPIKNQKSNTKCFICSGVIDNQDPILSGLSELVSNQVDTDLVYCAKCLKEFDEKNYEMYKQAFSRKIPASIKKMQKR